MCSWDPVSDQNIQHSLVRFSDEAYRPFSSEYIELIHKKCEVWSYVHLERYECYRNYSAPKIIPQIEAAIYVITSVTSCRNIPPRTYMPIWRDSLAQS
jgi:hypothetical protein